MDWDLVRTAVILCAIGGALVLLASHNREESRRVATELAQRVETEASQFRKLDVNSLIRTCEDPTGVTGDALNALHMVCHERAAEIAAANTAIREKELRSCKTGLPAARCAELFDALDCVNDFDSCADRYGYYPPNDDPDY